MEEQGRNAELEMEDVQADHGNSSLPGTWLCCLPCYWLKRNDRVEKTLLTVATLLVSALLVASPVIFLMSSAPMERSITCSEDCWVSEKRVCQEDECLTAKRLLTAAMDNDWGPCDDFQKFSCGRIFQESEVNCWDDALLASVRDHLPATADPAFKKLGSFYKSCIRTGDKRISFTSMLALLKELGGYIDPGMTVPLDLTNLVLRLMRLNGSPLFHIKLMKNPVSSELVVDLTTKLHVQCVQLEEQDKIIMENILAIIIPETVVGKIRVQEINNTVFFATELAKINRSIRKPSLKQHKATVSQLQVTFPFVQWNLLIQGIFQTENLNGQSVIWLYSEHLTEIGALLHRFNDRVIHNGLLLTFAKDMLYPIVNTSTHSDWSLFCAKLTTELFKEPVAAHFLIHYPSNLLDKARVQVNRILSSIKHTLEKLLKKSTRLDETDSNKLLIQINNLEAKIPSYEKYRNTTSIAQKLDALRMDQEDLFGNTMRRYSQIAVESGTSIEDPNPEDDPFYSSALFLQSQNVIVIPLALIIQPLFNENLPPYVQFSTLGQEISQRVLLALLHYVNNTKAQFTQDTINTLRDWIKCNSKISSQEFTEFATESFPEELTSIELARQAWLGHTENSENEPGLPELDFNNDQLFLIFSTQTLCMNLRRSQTCSAGSSCTINRDEQRTPKLVKDWMIISEAFKCSASKMNTDCSLR